MESHGLQARAALSRLVAALLLGGLGRLLVLRAPELADGVVLRLDESVALLSAIVLGAPWGAVASLVATVGTPEPAFSAIWALEALLVGLAVRRGVAPVVAVVGYWLLVGAVFFTGLVPAPEFGIDARLLLAKQVVNGTLSAALAQVVASLALVRRLLGVAALPDGARSLRAQFARALVPVATIPVILLGLGLGRIYATHLVNEGTADLETRVTTTAARLADHLSATERDVATLAGSLSGPLRPTAEIERILRLHHSGTVLATMAVSDADGQLVALSSRPEGLVRDRPLPSVADRPYYEEPRRTGRLFRSNGFHGRGFVAATNADLVAVSAPYQSEVGTFAGVVQGTVGLAQLSAWLARTAAGPGVSCLVLDAAGQVIASAGVHSTPLLADGQRLDWVRATSAATTASFVDAASAPEGLRPERFVTVRRDIPGAEGWQVHVRRSLGSMQAPLVPFYLVSAGWLLFCVVVATIIANRVSRHITHPIEVLARHAEAIGRGHDRPQTALPATAPSEVHLLQRELDAMVARLDDAVRLLDDKVRERTAELAAATARNDTVFRTASDGMAVLDDKRVVLEANDAFCRLLGLPHDRVIGLPIRDVEVGATDEARRQRRAVLARTGTARFETLLRTADGDALPVEVVLSDMPGGDGRVFGSVRDISERRRAETERAQLEARLRQSQKLEAIGTLAGGIAHDFNNILTLIAGSADLAATDVPAGHPARPYLDQIQRASARAEALVRQILTFSRRRDEQREVVALPPIVREAAGILRSTLPAMIEIRTEIDDGVPAVQADPVQMHQVLMNLGSNAGHAMRDRGGVLTITLQPSAAPGDDGRPDAVLTVSDTGAGMDRATLERVFEPFFTTKPVGIGTGLGLAVVHGIVTSHGGTIEATSAPGRGTTFRVTLPPADHAVPAGSEAVAPPPTPAHRPAHVLVVDDEPELVGLMCKQLTRLGYTARGCTAPSEALDLLRTGGEAVDVVMSDLAMPRMSGIELAEEIHRVQPDLPIVLCSGRVSDDDRDRAVRAGGSEILAKPFASQQLADAMHRSLGAHGTRH